jgi:alpha-L-rhamnosidase
MAKLFALFSSVVGNFENEKVYLAKAAEIRAKLREEFLVDCGKNLKGFTAHAAALYFDLAENEEKTAILERLISLIEQERYRALFGILGAKYVHNVLCAYGKQDVFVKMMECDEYPSFGAWIQRDATTLWEDFEGTNSRNHHMFADIASVMQTYLLGVQQGEDGILIQPYLDNFTHLQGRVITVNGSVYAAYTKQDDKWRVELSIPYGVKATFKHQDKIVVLSNGNNVFYL